MRGRLTSGELADWMIYYKRYPFGPGAEDRRHALLLSLLANCHRDPKRKPSPFTPDEFLLGVAETPERVEDGGQSVEEQKQLFENLMAGVEQ